MPSSSGLLSSKNPTRTALKLRFHRPDLGSHTAGHHFVTIVINFFVKSSRIVRDRGGSRRGAITCLSDSDSAPSWSDWARFRPATIPFPPLEQLYNRYCSNKHTHIFLPPSSIKFFSTPKSTAFCTTTLVQLSVLSSRSTAKFPEDASTHDNFQ
jgi:hypothetical protein